MPLHRIYCTKGIFTAAEKEAISQSITKCYSILPPFYVVVVFLEVEPDNFYIGGERNARFVRIVSQHFARTKSDGREDQMVEAIQSAFTPYVSERGLDWEIHIEYIDRSSWRENGLRPPMPDTEAEKLWIKLNKPVPYA